MNFLPEATFLNIILLLFLFVFVAAFGIFLMQIYRFLSRWLLLLHKEKLAGSDKIKDQAHHDAARVLDEARNKAIKIMTDASNRAQFALSSVENLSKDSKEKIAREIELMAQQQSSILEGTSKELLSSYKKVLQEQKADSLSSLKEASTDIEKELINEVDEFKTLLHKETVETQKEVQEKVTQEYQKIEKELESYRTRRIKEVEENVYNILADATKRVLGESLDMEEHQALIIKALEEAKQNNMFSSSK